MSDRSARSSRWSRSQVVRRACASPWGPPPKGMSSRASTTRRAPTATTWSTLAARSARSSAESQSIDRPGRDGEAERERAVRGEALEAGQLVARRRARASRGGASGRPWGRTRSRASRAPRTTPPPRGAGPTTTAGRRTPRSRPPDRWSRAATVRAHAHPVGGRLEARPGGPRGDVPVRARGARRRRGGRGRPRARPPRGRSSSGARRIAHKTERGLVRLALADDDAVADGRRGAARRRPARGRRGAPARRTDAARQPRADRRAPPRRAVRHDRDARHRRRAHRGARRRGVPARARSRGSTPSR